MTRSQLTGQEIKQIRPKGGATVAKIYDPDHNAVAEGIAVCSDRDPFSKARGRQIALGRALAALEETA